MLEACFDSILTRSTYEHFELIGLSNNSVLGETSLLMEKLAARDQRIRFEACDFPFNYSRLNNYASSVAQGEHLVLLNNDTRIISPEWLESLLEHSQRPEVGVVGAKMFYGDGTIEHAGIIVGLFGYLAHMHRRLPADHAGYHGRLKLIQNVTAVMASCMMVKRDLYLKAGGLDEKNLRVAYNDIDFCLRLLKMGYLNVFTPYCQLYHFESYTRGMLDTPEKRQREYEELLFVKANHGEFFRRDPYYNANLPRDRDDFGMFS